MAVRLGDPDFGNETRTHWIYSLCYVLKRSAGGGPELELRFDDSWRVSLVKCYFTQ